MHVSLSSTLTFKYERNQGGQADGEGRGGVRRVMNDAIMYNLELSSLFTASSLRAAGGGPAGLEAGGVAAR